MLSATVLAACGGGGGDSTTPTTTASSTDGTVTTQGKKSTGSGSTGGTTTTSGSGTGTTSGSTSGTSGTTSGSTSGATTTTTTTTTTTGPTIAGCPVFPATAIFNTRIDDTTQFPAHASSATWRSAIDSTGARRLHLDWGTNEDQTQHSAYYGIPYNVVDGTTVRTNWPIVTYSGGVPDESDCAVSNGAGGYNIKRDCSTVTGRLPIPTDATVKLEGGYCPVGQYCPEGDHHILVVEKGTCRLWEAYYATGAAEQSANGSWNLYGSAAWDLNSLVQRPAGWTSVDAAGLPILPLLARVDEANAGEVKHALRLTLRSSVMANSYVWPARHRAGQSGPIPFGALMRLRSDFVIPSTWTTQAKALATAMKRYGVYVADNGSDMYIQGEPSALWQDSTWSQLQSITLSQFDFVSLNSITTRTGFNANSLAASW